MSNWYYQLGTRQTNIATPETKPYCPSKCLLTLMNHVSEWWQRYRFHKPPKMKPLAHPFDRSASYGRFTDQRGPRQTRRWCLGIPDAPFESFSLPIPLGPGTNRTGTPHSGPVRLPPNPYGLFGLPDYPTIQRRVDIITVDDSDGKHPRNMRRRIGILDLVVVVNPDSVPGDHQRYLRGES